MPTAMIGTVEDFLVALIDEINRTTSDTDKKKSIFNTMVTFMRFYPVCDERFEMQFSELIRLNCTVKELSFQVAEFTKVVLDNARKNRYTFTEVCRYYIETNMVILYLTNPEPVAYTLIKILAMLSCSIRDFLMMIRPHYPDRDAFVVNSKILIDNFLQIRNEE